MSYELSDSEFRVANMLSAEGRYDYFVDKVVAGGEVWSLQSEEGWVSVTSEDGDECLPVWPHPRFAATWAVGDWSDCTPTAIPLDVWVTRWTPGMEKDGTMLAVFPDQSGEGDIVAPGELLQSIEIAMGEG